MTLLPLLVLLAGAPDVDKAAGVAAFENVARVLLSPRCMNCHPRGDAPLQGDTPKPHAQNITRKIEGLGMRCGSCHQSTNLPGRRMPPGAPKWGLPPAATPMVFEGKTAAQLCKQLKDPATNGKKTVAEVVHHMTSDALVKWGWTPGEGRTQPPLTHAQFAEAARIWGDAGAPCPE